MDPLKPKDGEYPEHQLTPLEGGRYVLPIHGPPGTEIGTLPAEIQDVDGAVVISSGWMPTEDQKKRLESGAHVRVSLWTYPMVPIAVGIDPPICACHGEDMEWSGEDSGYYCSHTPPTPLKARTALEQAHSDFTPEQVDEGDD